MILMENGNYVFTFEIGGELNKSELGNADGVSQDTQTILSERRYQKDADGYIQISK